MNKTRETQKSKLLILKTRTPKLSDQIDLVVLLMSNKGTDSKYLKLVLKFKYLGTTFKMGCCVYGSILSRIFFTTLMSEYFIKRVGNSYISLGLTPLYRAACVILFTL